MQASGDKDNKSNSLIAPSAETDENDKRDNTTRKRENFLSIYKES